jgi:predicted AlkP superfamily pyrophosphatase or phosphodiesterase
MSRRVAILNVVGLTRSGIGPNTPHIQAFARRGSTASIRPAFPAVTCTAQSAYLTGLTPAGHGIVANGWYDRESAETRFWKQSNHLVKGAKLWDRLRAKHPGFTCAQLFWWFNMHASVDFSITPRPAYPADGRKVFDIYTGPSALGDAVKKDLGAFPFATFWGPAAGVDTPGGRADAASRWIAQSAMWVEERHSPDLSLIYLPHLDYNLQRFGPDDPRVARDWRAIDAIVGGLLDFYSSRSVQCAILSEYGITSVDTPVHLNRVFRENGWIAIRKELGLELLDCGASRVFAVADHQVAHIYINDPTLEPAVRRVLENQPGVEAILGGPEKQALGLDHPRSGDLVAVASERSWFTYYYWLEDCLAPDFARCVDIHRKPGYDPVELFLDPDKPLVKGRILWRLLQKKLGFRMLMDVIPLDATLVRGSHGRRGANPANDPVLIIQGSTLPSRVDATDVSGLLERLRDWD